MDIRVSAIKSKILRIHQFFCESKILYLNLNERVVTEKFT